MIVINKAKNQILSKSGIMRKSNQIPTNIAIILAMLQLVAI